MTTVALIYFDALQKGGYPRDVRWLAGALAARGHRVTLIANPGPDREGLGTAELISPRQLRVLSDTQEVDVTHSFGVFTPRQLFFQRRMRSGAHVLSTLGHLMEAHLERHPKRKNAYLRAWRTMTPPRLTAHIFSNAERDGVAQYLPGVPCFEASAGLFPAPLSRQPFLKKRRDTLVFFGRNDVFQKGIDVLLEGYAAAVARGLRLNLLIAGAAEGDSNRVITEDARRLNLADRVVQLGKVDESEKWRLLQSARALVFLSRWDGPPRPIREALAVGTPVIVSAGTNLGQYVTQAGAGAAVRLDPADVASAMLRAESDARVGEWRAGVLRLQEILRWDRVADQYLAGYESARDSARGAR